MSTSKTAAPAAMVARTPKAAEALIQEMLSEIKNNLVPTLLQKSPGNPSNTIKFLYIVLR